MSTARDNPVRDKSFSFALRIVGVYRHLTETRKEFVLSKQLLRSGTSIGANIEEAIGGESKADFIHKMGISYKEARETHYWLRLLRGSGYLSDLEADPLIQDCDELLKLIGSIQKSSKKNS